MINIQNTDGNECFEWFFVRYVNPPDRNSRKTTKFDKDFIKRLDFKDIKFPVKFRDIHKIEENNSISISVFGYEKKEKISNLCIKTMFDLLFIEEGEKNTVVTNDFNRFVYNRLLHRGEKSFLSLLFASFHHGRVIKASVNNCFKTNGKQTIVTPKKGGYVKLKIFERKRKLPFTIYVDL